MKYLLPLLLLALCSCGKELKATENAYAEQVKPPIGWGASLYCFVVRDENGKAVGGNCIPR